MKNLINKIFLTGMVGAGSLGIFGNKGYGQEIYKGVALQVIDNDYDHIVDEYALYFIKDNSLNIFKYVDENDDGEIDLYSLDYYLGHTNKIIHWTSGKINRKLDDEDLNPKRHKQLLSKFQENYSIGTFSLNKEKTCDKKNLLDCLIDLF